MGVRDGWMRSAASAVVLLAGCCALIAAAGCGGGEKAKESQGNAPDSGMARAHDHGMGAGEDHGSTAANQTTFAFASAPASIPAGTPAEWTLTIRDSATGGPVKGFDTVHQKLMHLIVVSSDLSWFNHIHPEYKGDGRFIVKAVLPRAGSYKLYADYTLAGGNHEVQQYELATGGGTYQPAAPSLTPDAPGEGGWIVRKTVAKPEGMPDEQGGDEYQVALMPMPMKLVAGQDAMLHFQVRDAAGKPVAGLEPYLGAMGHAVLLSADTKTYLHTHPMEGGAEHGGMHHDGMEHAAAKNGVMPGHNHETMMMEEDAVKKKPASEVMFHTNFPAPGLYKVWGQFQHKGRIITAAYVLSVGT